MNKFIIFCLVSFCCSFVYADSFVDELMKLDKNGDNLLSKEELSNFRVMYKPKMSFGPMQKPSMSYTPMQRLPGAHFRAHKPIMTFDLPRLPGAHFDGPMFPRPYRK